MTPNSSSFDAAIIALQESLSIIHLGVGLQALLDMQIDRAVWFSFRGMASLGLAYRYNGWWEWEAQRGG
jgi:hypothetical protein